MPPRPGPPTSRRGRTRHRSTPTTTTDHIPRAFIGISGWRYARWRGDFYPRGLRQADELAYVAERLDSVEINGSFYSLQRPTSWMRWRDTVGDGFVFAVKGPRFVTHMKRLRDVEEALANFFASGVLALGARLGPIVWQTPADLAYDPDLVGGFLDLLPRTTVAALDLARRRHERMHGREHLEIDADRPLRHAFEPRHPSFDSAEFAVAAADREVAIVAADSAGTWPAIDRVTEGFVYARLHGDTELYASGYSDTSLDAWADWVRRHLDAGRDAYVYFDNDARGHAPHDAVALRSRLKA
jgi:uncharacterized protein YecE (DUF72 family)